MQLEYRTPEQRKEAIVKALMESGPATKAQYDIAIRMFDALLEKKLVASTSEWHAYQAGSLYTLSSYEQSALVHAREAVDSELIMVITPDEIPQKLLVLLDGR
jgi:hypothetical protein